MKKSVKYATIIVVVLIVSYFLVPAPSLKIDISEVLELNAGSSCKVNYYDYQSDIGSLTSVEVISDVDCMSIGSYSITYVVTRLSKKSTYTQRVEVVDKEAPRIYHSSSEVIEIQTPNNPDEITCSYKYPSYSVVDNYDEEVKFYRVGEVDPCNEGEYDFKYIATDESENSSEVSFKVIVTKNEKSEKRFNYEEIVVTADVLNIRSDHNIDGEVIGNVKFGEIYEVLSLNYDNKGREWFKIKKGEVEGYIAAWYTSNSIVDINKYHFFGSFSVGDKIEGYEVSNVEYDPYGATVIIFEVNKELIVEKVDFKAWPTIKLSENLLEKSLVESLYSNNANGVIFDWITFTSDDYDSLYKFFVDNTDEVPLVINVKSCGFVGYYLSEYSVFCTITSAKVKED